MKKSKLVFSVKPFENANGSRSWRVEGRVRGKRVRENFKQRAAALGRRDELELEARVAGGELRNRMTRLTLNQIRIAEMLFERAADDDSVLSLLPLLKVSERKGVKAAKVAWLSALERAGKREGTIAVMGYLIDAFVEGSAAEFVDEVDRHDVEGFVFGTANRRTQADRRQRVGQWLKFCAGAGWCVRNCAAEIPEIKVERGLPVILSPEQVGSLLDASRRFWRPWPRTLELYPLLTGFTGLRPTEARRITRDLVHLDDELCCIEVSPRVAKVSQCRQVKILPEVKAKLETGNWKPEWNDDETVYWNEKHWRRIRKEAGVLDLWCNDVLRHTYASWHYAIFQDIDHLKYTMGNSREVLFENYIRPMTEKQARKYLAVLGQSTFR